MSRCPYCEEPAETGWEEVRHMQEYHPEVIAARLRNAGYAQRTACNARPPEGHPFHGTGVACYTWTGHEFSGIPHTWEHRASSARLGLNRLLALMPTRDLDTIDWGNQPPMISFDTKTGESTSLGPAGEPGPWVTVIFTGGDRYAIWKTTGSVYRIGPDGAVDEDPMLTLDGDPDPR